MSAFMSATQARQKNTSQKAPETSVESCGISDIEKSFRDIVYAPLPAARRSRHAWLTRLPDEVRAKLSDLKSEFRGGSLRMSARELARRIIEFCDTHGYESCSWEHMRSWLTEP